MPLSYPKLELPNVEETVAFRTIDTILRRDPTMKRIVRQFTSFRGDATDTAGPTPATCPYLQLAPRPTTSKWEAEGMHSMPFVIAINAAVNGSNIDEIMNYWGHIRRALWPSNAERSLEIRALAAAAGITRPTMTMNGFGSILQKDGGRVLVAQGSLNVLLLINTP